jgi:hypothetical protein
MQSQTLLSLLAEDIQVRKSGKEVTLAPFPNNALPWDNSLPTAHHTENQQRAEVICFFYCIYIYVYSTNSKVKMILLPT